ncbi:MAG: hypothetical protein HAW61_05960 [Candidatus Portiera sp.]|nr:hypothetical protein [Portiera sp.]
MRLNPNQNKFLKLILWVLAPQILLAGGLGLFSLSTHLWIGHLWIGMASSDLAGGFLAGGLVYAVAFGSYGLMYFTHRGAAASGKIVGSLILAVVIKYLVVLVLSSILLVYSVVLSAPFFIGLLLNHLVYLVANSIYMSNNI